MYSLTKNEQNKETLSKMVDKFFNPLKMESYKELTEGYFNIAYEIRLNNNKEIILKIAPLKETRVMNYEKNIMYSEVEAMKTAKKIDGIPLPDVLGYDDTCTICKSPYFFMEKLNGKSLNTIKNTLSPQQIANIYTEFGKINRKINEMKCPCFGYPGHPELQGTDWYSTFLKIMESCILDAQNGNVNLKISIPSLMDYFKKDKPIFDEVTEPRLVHWDCWDGNIFIKDTLITGIIDWERSIWGDPLLEVGFRTYSDNTYFQKGYNIGVMTANQLRRALWYDIYFLILASCECEYRKYDTTEMYDWASQLLEEQFDKLKNQ